MNQKSACSPDASTVISCLTGPRQLRGANEPRYPDSPPCPSLHTADCARVTPNRQTTLRFLPGLAPRRSSPAATAPRRIVAAFFSISPLAARRRRLLAGAADRQIEPGDEPVTICVRNGRIVDFRNKPEQPPRVVWRIVHHYGDIGWLVRRNFLDAGKPARIAQWTDEITAMPECRASRWSTTNPASSRREGASFSGSRISVPIMNGSMRRSAAAGLRALSVSFSARHRACSRKRSVTNGWAGFEPHQDQQARRVTRRFCDGARLRRSCKSCQWLPRNADGAVPRLANLIGEE
jgi:hypothetical protein